MTVERICPKGHVSTDPDYCSECGARLDGVAGTVPPKTAIAREELAASADGEPCPVCGTRRVVGARFCEVCRYDFQTATLPGAASTPAPSQQTPTESAADVSPQQSERPTPKATHAPASMTSATVPQRWDVIVAVDPSLNKNPDPAQPCPQNAPERTFPLDLDENLVGRRSDKKDIHPEIMVADPGISRRHLSIRRRDDGGLMAIELGSTNGTSLNAAPLEPGIPTPLNDGAQLTLGCWTRMTIRAR
jgi:hypothetical protein